MRPLDAAVLLGYLALVVGIGLVAARTGKGGLVDYFQGGGRLPWWAVGLSLIATSLSASSFLGTPAESFAGDLRLLLLNAAPFVSLVLLWRLVIPWLRSTGARSAYELLEGALGRRVRVLAALFYVLHLLLRTGVLVLGPALLLSQLAGLSLDLAILGVGLVATLYAAFGGLRAVVWTDALQFLVLWGGLGAILWVATRGVPGGSAAVLRAAKEAGKLRVLDLSLDLASPHTVWAAGLAYVVLDLALRSCDQQFVQRYLAVRDLARARRAAALSVLAGLGTSLALFATGLALWGWYSLGAGELPAGTRPDQVLPHFVAHALPPGLTGLVAAAVAAAAMSSVDSAVSALSNTALVDLLPRWAEGPNATTRARILALCWGALGTLAALGAARLGRSLLHTALSFTSLFTGSLFALFVLAWLARKERGPRTWRPSGAAAFWGALLGLATLGLVKQLVSLAWPWHPPVAFGVTLLAARGVDLFKRRRSG